MKSLIALIIIMHVNGMRTIGKPFVREILGIVYKIAIKKNPMLTGLSSYSKILIGKKESNVYFAVLMIFS